MQNETLQLVNSRSGDPTLIYDNDNGTPVYLHSRYNPREEAEKFVEQYRNLGNYKHIFFYGIGLGYHIEAMQALHPQVAYSVYEPNASVFVKFLETRLFKDVFRRRPDQLYIQWSSADITSHVSDFINKIKDHVLLVVLPSYERAFQEEFRAFQQTFIKAISGKRSALNTNFAFEKRWIVNGMLNIKHTLESPSILDKKRQHFEQKPAIIVSAGPSLEEELENLRQIKESGTAYIFAVGSAINALLSAGIQPDAACTYDPSALNQKVFEKLVQQNIDNIPLIYGTTVGFETLQQYPGPKLHMITSQDSTAAVFLKKEEGTPLEVVNDAPSIAVITLQLLYRLGCNPIILVGQNLSYKDERFYSAGIEYSHRPSKLSEAELQRAFPVEAVDGSQVLTNNSLNQMRLQIEQYIKAFDPQTVVINTTQGGANIEGTRFEALRDVMSQYCKEACVEPDWMKGKDGAYDVEYLRKQSMEMEEAFKELCRIFDQLVDIMRDLKRFADQGNARALEGMFPKFDRVFKRMKTNQYHYHYIQPMNRVQFEILLKHTQEIRFQRDQVTKANMLLDVFGKYLSHCRRDLEQSIPVFGYMLQAIREYAASKTELAQSS